MSISAVAAPMQALCAFLRFSLIAVMLSATGLVSSSAQNIPSGPQNVSYTYDALGRLETVTYEGLASDGGNIKYTYAYDPAGNRTVLLVEGSAFPAIYLQDVYVLEGQVIRIPVFVSANPRGDVQFNWNVTSGGSHVSVANGIFQQADVDQIGQIGFIEIATVDNNDKTGVVEVVVEISQPEDGVAIDPANDEARAYVQDNDITYFTIDDKVVTEGGDLVFDVTRVVPASADTSADPSGITVSLNTLDVTAERGVDYTEVDPLQVTFAPSGPATQSVTVETLFDDATTEGDELLRVLADWTAETFASQTAAHGTIQNGASVSPSTFGIQSVSVEEGNAATLTVNRSAGGDREYDVSFTILGSSTATAGAGADYTLNTSSPFTFLAGQNQKTISFDLHTDDDDTEGAETIDVEISWSDQGGPLQTATGTLTINDAGGPVDPNNNAPVAVNDNPEPYQLPIVAYDDPATGGTFDSDTSNIPNGAIPIYLGTGSFNVIANDTDADGDALTVQSVSVAAGSHIPFEAPTITNGGLNITATFNQCGTYSFDYVVADPSGAADTGVLTVTTTPMFGGDHCIAAGTDPDPSAGNPKPTVTVDDPAPSVNEGTELAFRIRLSNTYRHSVHVDFTLSGAAIEGTDYHAPATNRITFGSNQDDKLVRIQTIGDTDLVDGNKDLTLTITNVINGDLGTASSATGTILDDDSNGNRTPLLQPDYKFVTLELVDVNNSYIGQGTFDVLENDSDPDGDTLILQNTFRLLPDYIGNGTITVTNGVASGSFTQCGRYRFAYDVKDNHGATATSFLDVRTTNDPSGCPLAIFPLDEPVPEVNIADAATVEEGGTLVFTVTLSKTYPDPVRIPWSVTNNAGDATTTEGILNFDPGQPLSQTIELVTDDDTSPEGDETITVTLGELVNADAGTITATATVTDNEETSTPATTSGDPATTQGQFIPAGSTVNITLAGGAGGKSHWQECCSGLPIGGSGGKATFEFTATKDFYMRNREGKTGTASINGAPGYGTSGQGGGASAIAISADGQSWTPVAIVGGGGGTGFVSNRGGDGGGLNLPGMDGAYHASATNAGGGGANVNSPGIGGSHPSYSPPGANGGAPGDDGGSSDKPGGQGDATFGIGGGGGPGYIFGGGGGGGRYGGGGPGTYSGGGGGSGYWNASGWVQIVGVEPTITLNQTGGNAGDGAATITVDDSGASGGEPPVFSISDAGSVVEGGSLSFVVTKTGTTTSDYTVTYTVSFGTAQAADITSAATGTVVFGANDPTQTITINTVDDTIDEFDSESLSVVLVSAGGGELGNAVGTGIINDNDVGSNDGSGNGSGGTPPDPTLPTISMSGTPVGADEGGTLLFPVSISAAPDGTAMASWAVTAGASEVTVSSGTVSFSGAGTQTISIPTFDDADENHETVTVSLNGVTQNAVLGGTLSASATITDGDIPVPNRAPVAAVDSLDLTATPLGVGNAVQANGSKNVLANDTDADGDVLTISNLRMVTGYAELGDGGSMSIGSGGTINVTVLSCGTRRIAYDVSDPDGLTDSSYLIVEVSVPQGQECQQAAIVTPPPVVPSISLGNAAAVPEGDTLSFPVSISEAPTSTVTVNWNVTSGASDVESIVGTVTFPAGSAASQTISVPSREDDDWSQVKNVTVTLSGASSGATIADGSGTGQIENDDGEPIINIFNKSRMETDGNITMQMTIFLQGGTTQPVTVNYATSNGTATAGSDYVATSGSVTIQPGDFEATVEIDILGDTTVEPDEYFNLEVTSAVNARTVTSNITAQDPTKGSNGRGTIRNDDQPPAPSFSVNNASVSEGGSVTFTVTKVGSTSSSYSVNYATSTNTASSSDFTAKSGILVFSASESSKTVSVSTTEDSSVESNETFYLNLSSASGGATISDNRGTGTIVNDDSAPPPPTYTYRWYTGTYGACNSSGRKYRTVTCKRDPGNTSVGDSSCTNAGLSKPSTSTTSGCTAPPPPPPTYTYDWDYGTYSSWPACTGQTTRSRTRSATCKRNDGVTVSDSFCSGSPTTTQTDTCGYSWFAESWNPWSCTGIGNIRERTRDVYCRSETGNQVSNGKCSGSAPSTYETETSSLCSGQF